jgi:hypothetical protein
MEVEFYWYHDRWAHRVFIDGQPVWESLEGPRVTLAPGISDRWPASPVFTEIMPTETTSGLAVLGVGLAGLGRSTVGWLSRPPTLNLARSASVRPRWKLAGCPSQPAGPTESGPPV